MGGRSTYLTTMDRSTVIGLSSGLALILIAIISEGGLFSFISISSLIIVLGGVTSAILVNYTMNDLIKSMTSIRIAFSGRQFDMLSHIEMFTLFARRARRNGLLILDDDVQYIQDSFLRNGMELAIDGVSEENLKDILDDEIKAMQRRHDVGIRVLESAGSYSPAFGMIGTLIGLILMLRNLDNATGIGEGLAIALITTFYGTILANLVFYPLSGKLQELSAKELNEKEMMRAAIISLANGENPRIMEKKMLSYVTPEDRAEYLRMFGERGYTQQQEDKLYTHWVNQQREKWEGVLSGLQPG